MHNARGPTAAGLLSVTELELELVQPHMAQKPVLRGEVGCACVAREVSVERGGMCERPTSSSGLRVQGCQCTTLPPQLFLLRLGPCIDWALL